MESKINKYIVVRYSELSLKGGNKKEFARHLTRTIKEKIKAKGFEAFVNQQRDLIRIESENDLYKIPSVLKYIVGISSYSFYYEVEDSIENFNKLLEEQTKFYPEQTRFRISVKLVDSQFQNDKDEVIKYIAWKLTNENKFIIDLQNYLIDVNVRFEQGKITLHLGKQDCIIGLPAGVNGKFLTLLSGGIDSPVAAFKTITRGLNSSFITFLTPRTSSAETIAKVKKLATIANRYNSTDQKLFIVNFEPVQEEIMKLENETYRIVLLRRFFMRFAEMVSKKYGYKFLVTGDSLGQVASQTPESMQLIDNSVKTLIVRPLVSMSKNEIIKVAYDIDTYETSIAKGDDMCSIFTPKNPIIFPKEYMVNKLEEQLQEIEEVLWKVFDNDMRVIDLKEE